VKGPNKILFYRAGHLTLIDPGGKNEKRVSQNRGEFMPSDAKLSPDGKTLAVLIRNADDATAAVPRPVRRQLYVRGLDDKEPGTDTGVACQMVVWSPDGTRLAASQFEDAPNTIPAVTHQLVTVKTNEKAALRLPNNHLITGWLPDDRLLTVSVAGTPEKPSAKMHLMNLDGTEHKTLTDAGRASRGWGCRPRTAPGCSSRWLPRRRTRTRTSPGG
jgi:Tol biopolymer transport system component